MKITDKGQVTIPRDIRNRMGLLPNTEVEFSVSRGEVVLRRATGERRRGKRIVEHLLGRATRKLTTDDIMKMTRGE